MTTEKTAEAEPAPSSGSGGDAAVHPRRRGWLTFLRDVVVIILIAVLVSFLVKTFLVRSFYIPSGSMKDTLHIDDRILVDEITPRFGGYDHGDIVVFQDPGGWLPPSSDPARPPVVEAIDWVLALVGLSAPDSDDHLVKRIIGLPGDHVICCNTLGQITVNGVPIDETDYIVVPTGSPPPRATPSTSPCPPTACGCSATIATSRRTRATTRTSRATASSRSTTSSGERSS
nr:hypothetical protein GCM10025699_29770 [Microbacterium flavescens]